MKTLRILTILVLGGLMTAGAWGQDASGPAEGDPADQMQDDYLANMAGEGVVTLIEPYNGYDLISLDELSAALSMPAGPNPWDLGEFAGGQDWLLDDAYDEAVTIIDEDRMIVGIFELPGEEGFAPADVAALPEEPPTAPGGAVSAVPVAYTSKTLSTSTALASSYAFGSGSTVYATTADYTFGSSLYAPTHYSYFYAYPGPYAPIVLPLRTRRLWPPLPLSAVYPGWGEDFFLGLPYYGTYAGYSYSCPSYFGTYLGYPYAGYFGTYAGYPYTGSYVSYSSYPFRSTGSYLSFSAGFGNSWYITGSLGLPSRRHYHYRPAIGLRSLTSSRPRIHVSGRSIGRSIGIQAVASAPAVRPWRPSVTSRINSSRRTRSIRYSTDRSRPALLGRTGASRRTLSTASAAPAATVTPTLSRTLTTGRAGAGRTGQRPGSFVSSTGATARGRLDQQRQAYMNVLGPRNAATGSRTPAITSTGTPPIRGARGAGALATSRRSSPTGPDAAVAARQSALRTDLLRRLNVMSARPGSSPTSTGRSSLTRAPLSSLSSRTFGPQVAPTQARQAPTVGTTAQPRTFTPRTTTPRTFTPSRSVPSTGTLRTVTPSRTAPSTYTPRTFTPSRTAPSTYTRTFTPTRTTPSTPASRTFTPSRTAPSTYASRTFTPTRTTPSTPAPRTFTPSRTTPSTYAPRTFTPSRTTPSTPAPRTYTPTRTAPSSYTPRTFTPSRTAPSTYTPRTFTPSRTTPSTPAPRTYTPSRTAQSTYTPSQTVPSTSAPRTFTPSRTAPSTSAPRTFTPSRTAPSTYTPRTVTPTRTTPRTSTPRAFTPSRTVPRTMTSPQPMAGSRASRSAPSPAPAVSMPSRSRSTIAAPSARSVSPSPSPAPSPSRSAPSRFTRRSPAAPTAETPRSSRKR